MKKIIVIMQESICTTFSGIEVYSHNLFRNLDSQNFEIEVIAKNNKRVNENIVKDNINYSLISIQKNKFLTHLYFFYKSCKLINQKNPHIIHGISFFPVGVLCIFYKFFFNRTTVIHAHASDVYFINKFLMRYLGSFIINYLDLVISITDHLSEFLARRTNCRHDKIFRLPISTNFHPSKKVKKVSSPLRILWIGNFRPLKGTKTMIKCYNLVQAKLDARLTIVGGNKSEKSSKYMIECMQFINNFKLEDNIKFTGSISSKQISNEYKNHDILVISSYSEGFPSIILEAAVNSLPIVSTNVGGISEFLSSDCLVSPGDHIGLAKKIITISESNYFRKNIIAQNYTKAQEEYSFEKTSNSLKSAYVEKLNA